MSKSVSLPLRPGYPIMIGDGAEITGLRRDRRNRIWLDAEVEPQAAPVPVLVEFRRWSGGFPGRIQAPAGFVALDPVPATDRGVRSGTASVFIRRAPVDAPIIPQFADRLERALAEVR